MTDVNIIWTHALAALLAVVSGGILLYGKKGTPWHKRLGWLWVVIMMVVACSGFFIRELREDGSMSWIHVLSVWTIVSLVLAVVAVKYHHVTLHKYVMIATFVGLTTAGLFSLLPDRFFGTIFLAASL
ncbi:MAG: DUF2306 domain-containing protein [Alphaproteobacteria bacterium GM7ARS4]|nr:DUF2306 domain-containing protein [Alphaproteobacteria bacterium GM7ARS4]